MELYSQLFQVENEIGRILNNPRDTRELVMDTCDLHGGDSGPSSEERRMRRREFPRVVPNPRSRGSAVNFPYVSVIFFESY